MDLEQFIAEDPGYVDYVDQRIDNLWKNFEHTKYLLTQDVSDDNFNDACQNFYKIITVIPLLKNMVEIPQILRARPNYSGEIFTEQSDISYNTKAQDKIKLGRFNRELEPLFYGSLPVENCEVDYSMACVLECCKELIDPDNPPDIQDFTLGAWLVKKPFEAITFCFDAKHLAGNPGMKKGVDKYLNAINSLTGKSSAFITEFLFFYSSLSGSLAEGERTYYVLTALFVAIRYYYKTVEKQKVYGLIYPSAMTEAAGLNIVLTRHAVDNFLKLDKVIMYRYFLNKPEKQYIAYPCSDMLRINNDHFIIPGYVPQGNALTHYF